MLTQCHVAEAYRKSIGVGIASRQRSATSKQKGAGMEINVRQSYAPAVQRSAWKGSNAQ